jgi:NADH-quinone oxidoreductase subunit A
LLLAWAWARWLGPGWRGAADASSYECGLPSTGVNHVRFNSEYYLYAILFLVFDVEAVFLLPFAVSFLELPLGGFLAALGFVFLLVEGLAWAWAKGILTWK